jgi:hypothetical protein
MTEALSNERAEDCLEECKEKTYLYQLTHTKLESVLSDEIV